jgi:hypothetical protein
MVRGAAWSIPVVAIAATAPAFAASIDPPSFELNSTTGCKQPGGPTGPNCQGYRMAVNLTVQPSDTWDVTLTDVQVNDVSYFATVPIEQTQFTVTSTSSIINFVICTSNSSPSQFNLTLVYSATNRRTGQTFTGLGGKRAVTGVNPCK